jgi:hypothetical protein
LRRGWIRLRGVGNGQKKNGHTQPKGSA